MALAVPSKAIKKRMLFLLFFLSFLVVAMTVRVAWIQVIRNQEYRKRAYLQQHRGITISAERGIIYDRNGKKLAESIPVDDIAVDPEEISKEYPSAEFIVEKLSEILEVDKETIRKKLDKKESKYEYILRKVDREKGDAIRKWRKEEGIKGIYIEEVTKRFYPNNNLASHVIGFTNVDNHGLYGIEASMDGYLKGTPGRILGELDINGREMPFSEMNRIAAKDGLNVVLTIDETIQFFTQKALEKAVKDYDVANGATAIVMDPNNGDILALVSNPDYDLNHPRAAPPGVDAENWKGTSTEEVTKLESTLWRNKAVTDVYEPGSTFKAITAAAALEENIVTPETIVECTPVKFGQWTIDCARLGGHGEETFAEGMYRSCNPVFVKTSQSLGIETFYKYMRAFGFYDRTQLGLLGETVGEIHDPPTELNMVVSSFGQRFTVTPMQMITSYTAIANGGKLMRPRLVKELTDDEGNIVKKFEPEVVRHVISKKTSNTLKEMLEGVVNEGTGVNAYVKGYRVAGKTGTSETLEDDRYVASFIAFAPADNPVISILVVLDNPRGEHGGGAVAAPVAGKLIDEILSYLDVDKVYTERDKELMAKEMYVPNVKGKTLEEARKILKQYELEYKVEDTADGIVQSQMPAAGASVPQKSAIMLYTTNQDPGQVMVTVPNLTNKTISEATKALKDLGLNIRIDGQGTAVKQGVEAGTQVPKGEVVDVEFQFVEVDSFVEGL